MTPHDQNLVISFSGGETSAYLARWALLNAPHPNKVVIFANTGQEHEETLKFVKMCDERFGLGVRWVETAIDPTNLPGHPGYSSKASQYREVTFETASRDGRPFEDTVRVHGLPNTTWKLCTKHMKERPIRALASELFPEGYTLAIGIRTDEMDRMSAAEFRGIEKFWYPLATVHPMTKVQINDWWRRQNFRLNIPHYLGNCLWCWKKSKRKLFTVMNEMPEAFDFPARLDAEHSACGPEFDILRAGRRNKARLGRPADPVEDRRKMFRGNIDTAELRAEFAAAKAAGKFNPAADLAQVYDVDLDTEGACGDSCEAFADADD